MSRIDISAIKTSIKSILDTANTTTAAVDLSGGLSTRIRSVQKIHPLRIAQQPSLIPCVTITTDSKTVKPLTIGNQSVGLREAIMGFDIIGITYEPFITNNYEDQGSENCERLMENIEEILRNNVTIQSNVAWHFPANVQYDEIRLDEQSHLRAGIMRIECKIHY